MTKKELLVLRREKDKLEKTLGGIRDMAKVPSAVWIVDTKKEHLAVDEAKKLGIPIVAILDTNCDPDEVDYKIPGNDDAIRSVTLLTRVVADAVADGLMARSRGASGDEGQVASDEPLAEWERELLAGDATATDATATDATATDATATDATATDATATDATASAPAAPAADTAVEPAQPVSEAPAEQAPAATEADQA
jgi:small subunit ribosomal protein S2